MNTDTKSRFPQEGGFFFAMRQTRAGSLQVGTLQIPWPLSILCWSRDLAGKPVPTFPDRAPGRKYRGALTCRSSFSTET